MSRPRSDVRDKRECSKPRVALAGAKRRLVRFKMPCSRHQFFSRRMESQVTSTAGVINIKKYLSFVSDDIVGVPLSSSALALLICLPSTSAIDHLRVNRRRMSGDDRRDRHGGRMLRDDRSDQNRTTFLSDHNGGGDENGLLDLDISDLSMSLAMTNGFSGKEAKSGKSGKTGKLPASIVPFFFKVGGGWCQDEKMDYYDIVVYFKYGEEKCKNFAQELQLPGFVGIEFTSPNECGILVEDGYVVVQKIPSAMSMKKALAPLFPLTRVFPEHASGTKFTLVGNDECVDRKGRFYNYVGIDQDLDDNEPEGCAALCTANYPVQGLVGFTYDKPTRQYPQALCQCLYTAGIGFQYVGIPNAFEVFEEGPSVGVGEVKDKIRDTTSGAFCYKNNHFRLPPGF
ncbi:hypothetical protein THAOC_30933 [Thalassiosira oceanica]|uniref:Uncharacterized protein n=1 Tax=Thalassiosira oceanica TaxID=159749 RepID=K0RD11_THAOC|nr:hypothetical protein THAOC_30933 [Thalassiosira oceanica]|eukprot:EJK50134.1 hypothetical protein THAOC_30933 [Thalassiosira oceanica]